VDRTFTSTSGTTIAWDPARGAKITSLRGADGREWLTQPGLRKSTAGASFGDAEMAGWDECAPTITACRVGAHELPDHGDAWDAAWDDKGQEVNHRGTAWPYRLTRWVTQTESGSIRLEYEASATREAIAFLWAAHPQFAAMPGTRVVVPDPPRTVVDVLTEEHLSEPWDERLMSIDCVGRGSHRKLYLPPEHAASSATLVHADGSALTLRWSQECHYLGLWFDNASIAERPVIAIEPSVAYANSLALTVEGGRAPVIHPRAPLRWWIEIEIV